jgi:nitroreductase
MDIMDAIHGRRAVRAYTAQTVDEAAIRKLIDAAIQAPSAVNEQPWCFTVVRDRALFERISREAKAHMLRTTAAGLVAHHLQSTLRDPEFDIFYRAPVLIVISASRETAWAVEDCSLAAENLMLAAYAAGLGTCWIGFAQGWLGTDEGMKALELSNTYRPVAPIIVGHPRVTPARVPRHKPEIRWIGS